MGYKSSINTGLPNIADPPDPKFFGELTRIYNAIRNLTVAVDAYTGALGEEKENFASTPPEGSLLSHNALRLYGKAVTAMSFGQIVSLHDDASGLVRFSLATALLAEFRPMFGWCSTPGGIAINEYGEIRLGGLCTAIGGLTIGITYYLGNTPGTIAPTAGQVSQRVGVGLGPNSIFFQPQLV